MHGGGASRPSGVGVCPRPGEAASCRACCLPRPCRGRGLWLLPLQQPITGLGDHREMPFATQPKPRRAGRNIDHLVRAASAPKCSRPHARLRLLKMPQPTLAFLKRTMSVSRCTSAGRYLHRSAFQHAPCVPGALCSSAGHPAGREASQYARGLVGPGRGRAGIEAPTAGASGRGGGGSRSSPGCA